MSLPIRTKEAVTADTTSTTTPQAEEPKVYALIDYGDDYVQPLILSALTSLFPPNTFEFLTPPRDGVQDEAVSLTKLLADNNIQAPPASTKILQITPYETLDFEHASSSAPGSCLINSYMIRKALIRKHFLTATVENWTAKHPDSVLRTHVKRSESFELDYAEFLDDALVEAFDLRASLERNEEVLQQQEGGGEKELELEWWILKPSMSDRGQGIRLFATMEQLQGIFDGWEVESDDEEEEEEDQAEVDRVGGEKDDGDGDGINTSHLRHFVAQPYIHPPMLLPEMDNRKFHIRTYVLCVGSMKVYVYRDMLALFAAKGYQAPSLSTSSADDEETGEEDVDLEAHLTNTCLQHGLGEINNSVHRFWAVPGLDGAQAKSIFEQICQVTGEIFEAAARGMMIHFQPLKNGFEVYGLDFLVDDKGVPWLLEVNAFPDFKQTGGLKSVVSGFWEGVVRIAVGGLVGRTDGGEATGAKEDGKEENGMVLVRDLDLGRRWG